MRRPLFLDIETFEDQLVCVGWAFGDDATKVEWGPVPPVEVVRAIADPDQLVITHTKYDLRWLCLLLGLTVRCQLHDTRVMAWLVNETLDDLSLEKLAHQYSGITMDKRLSSNGREFVHDDGTRTPLIVADKGQVKRYCAADVDATRMLYQDLNVLLHREGLYDYFIDTEAPFTRVLLDMEIRGLPVNVQDVDNMKARLKLEQEQLEVQLRSNWLPEAFNLRSPQQVASFLGCDRFYVNGRIHVSEVDDLVILHALAGTKMERETAPPLSFVPEGKGGRVYQTGVWVVQGLNLDKHNVPTPSVNKAFLMTHPVAAAHPWVQVYLQWKKLDKVISTYLDVFPKVAVKGRIHAQFNQTGTVTGRLSSSSPNLQNIPARGALGGEIRELFQGNLVVGDFAQLEPRLMAHFSRDPEMLRIFQNHLDIYTETAKGVGCDRQTAKVLVLAMGYGAGAQKLAEIMQLAGVIVSPQQARDLLSKSRALYGTYFQWRDKVIKEGERRGYVLTIDGRRRRVYTDRSQFSGWKGGDALARKAANAVIQGSAADVVRRTMLHVSKMFPELHLVGQVHDELIFEYDPTVYTPDLDRLKMWVEQLAGTRLKVPLVFDPHTGKDWKEAKG